MQVNILDIYSRPRPEYTILNILVKRPSILIKFIRTAGGMQKYHFRRILKLSALTTILSAQ